MAGLLRGVWGSRWRLGDLTAQLEMSTLRNSDAAHSKFRHIPSNIVLSPSNTPFLSALCVFVTGFNLGTRYTASLGEKPAVKIGDDRELASCRHPDQSTHFTARLRRQRNLDPN
jgi:hypothetical protein